MSETNQKDVQHPEDSGLGSSHGYAAHPCQGMRFQISTLGAARLFLRHRCGGNMGDDIAQDLAEVIDDFCKQSAHFAFDSAKECYKELHSGGCRMLTEGDNCQCFLCRIDNYKKIISEA